MPDTIIFKKSDFEQLYYLNDWPDFVVWFDESINRLMERLLTFLCFMLMVLAATSCELVGDIFGAGVYTGIFIVVVVIVLIVVIIAKIFRR
jgi:hypothetical protein